MKTPTKRKAFNFLRSYFDIMEMFEDPKDRLSFLEAIIYKQFTGKDPEGLNFVVKMAYESQRHGIESSVKGYMIAKGTDLKGNKLSKKDKEGLYRGSQGGSIRDPQRGVSKGSMGDPAKPPNRKSKSKSKNNKEINKESYPEIIPIERCVEILTSDDERVKRIGKHTGLAKYRVLQALKDFNNYLLATRTDKVVNFEEFVTHFTNWLDKKKQNYKVNSNIGI